MPVLQVYLFEGRTVEQKANLMRNLTKAVAESLGSPAQNVRILIQDMPRHNYAVGGVSVQAREDAERGTGPGQAFRRSPGCRGCTALAWLAVQQVSSRFPGRSCGWRGPRRP